MSPCNTIGCVTGYPVRVRFDSLIIGLNQNGKKTELPCFFRFEPETMKRKNRGQNQKTKKEKTVLNQINNGGERGRGGRKCTKKVLLLRRIKNLDNIGTGTSNEDNLNQLV